MGGLLCAIAWPIPAAEPASSAERLVADGDNQRNPFMKEVAAMLGKKDYEALEQLAGELRESKARFHEGGGQIYFFYRPLASPWPEGKFGSATGEEWSQLVKRLDGWVAARPKSGTARIALVLCLAEDALSNEGNADLWARYLKRAKLELAKAEPLAENDPELFRAKLEVARLKAREILEPARGFSKQDPEWFIAMQGVALGQGRGGGARDKGWQVHGRAFGNANIAGKLCFAVKGGLAAPSESSRLPRNGIAPEECVPKAVGLVAVHVVANLISRSSGRTRPRCECRWPPVHPEWGPAHFACK
jgi:hypothetical protein